MTEQQKNHNVVSATYFYGQRLFKWVDKNGNHGLKLIPGLNIDPKPFNPTGSCESGGIYFSVAKDIFRWGGYGYNESEFLHEVFLPADAKVYLEPCGTKFKADKIILSEPLVFTSSLIKSLIENGASINERLIRNVVDSFIIARNWSEFHKCVVFVKESYKIDFGKLTHLFKALEYCDFALQREILDELNENKIVVMISDKGFDICSIPEFCRLALEDVVLAKLYMKNVMICGCELHPRFKIRYLLSGNLLDKYYDLVEEEDLSGIVQFDKMCKALGIRTIERYTHSLYKFAESGNLDGIKLLVKLGATVNAAHSYALRRACEKQHKKVVDYLLKFGASVHSVNDDALRIAVRSDNIEVVKLLLKAGAYPFCTKTVWKYIQQKNLVAFARKCVLNKMK